MAPCDAADVCVFSSWAVCVVCTVAQLCFTRCSGFVTVARHFFGEGSEEKRGLGCGTRCCCWEVGESTTVWSWFRRRMAAGSPTMVFGACVGAWAQRRARGVPVKHTFG
ncbi:hypothetical protein TRSC58_07363 [Trypanosoma rangeli SC58]|uniref:Uncharacterized protein n=1 Tax=Trypanosoma rangeli SC58 TaxID=429131 RepID=A0A061IS23_TRYRA|nr:hypothetical protein TRSC58_07363 [Trypanosoma rangeli SC58]